MNNLVGKIVRIKDEYKKYVVFNAKFSGSKNKHSLFKVLCKCSSDDEKFIIDGLTKIPTVSWYWGLFEIVEEIQN